MLTPVQTKQLAESRLNAALDLLLEYLLGQSNLAFDDEPVTVMPHPEGNTAASPETQPVQ